MQLKVLRGNSALLCAYFQDSEREVELGLGPLVLSGLLRTRWVDSRRVWAIQMTPT